MPNLSLEFISVFGLPPIEFARLSAELGCQHITTSLEPLDYNPYGYERFSLRKDVQMRRDLVKAMADLGISLSMGEGFGIMPGLDSREAYASDIAIMAELGAPRINILSFDPHFARSVDELGAIAELAASHGIESLFEYVPTFGIADLPTAIEAIRAVGRADIRLLIDTMHTARSGATVADLAALEPDLIGYIQLCDAPAEPIMPNYLEEAMYYRNVPGEGELPLAEFLRVLPLDRVFGLEVPLRADAEAGIDQKERMARCVAGARSLLGATGRPTAEPDADLR